MWQGGDNVTMVSYKDSAVVETPEGKKYKWRSEGREWSKTGSKQPVNWYKASAESRTEPLRHVDEYKLNFGSSWTAPLETSINEEPDIVIFITDGSSHPDTKQISEKMAALASRKSVIINTVSIMDEEDLGSIRTLSKETGGRAHHHP